MTFAKFPRILLESKVQYENRHPQLKPLLSVRKPPAIQDDMLEFLKCLSCAVLWIWEDFEKKSFCKRWQIWAETSGVDPHGIIN